MLECFLLFVVQVLECNVVAYYEPGQYQENRDPRMAHVLVGAVDASPIYVSNHFTSPIFFL